MSISALAARRLGRLIKFMAALPASANKHFDMESWIHHEGLHQHFAEGDEITREHLHLCGTTACAAGWAAMIPSFRKAGLRLVYDGTSMGAISFERKEDGDALMQFFDIDYDLMADLFGSDTTSKTPKQWATRARQLLRDVR